ncbi:hypothetical protein [Aurantibacillus circumpalustris]|uniref:hypothetical protein n=1 Tax=Aurantibacillus circumpalustris TaxID=3036359 RepID=UPI00295B451C|nr:hypothetical protein [Aurantibacillus circumpalustris]
MRTKSKIGFLVMIVCLLTISTACRKDKLPDDLEPIKELFDGDGVWYVDKYIANGLDSSAYAFPSLNSNKEIARMVFKSKKAKDYPSPIVNGTGYENLFEYKSGENGLKFFNGISDCDNHTEGGCAMNVFRLWCGGSYWIITSLSKNRIEMSCKHDGLYNRDIAGNYNLVLVK